MSVEALADRMLRAASAYVLRGERASSRAERLLGATGQALDLGGATGQALDLGGATGVKATRYDPASDAL